MERNRSGCKGEATALQGRQGACEPRHNEQKLGSQEASSSPLNIAELACVVTGTEDIPSNHRSVTKDGITMAVLMLPD